MNRSVLYTLGSALYVNLTNRCPCSCSFCVRQYGNSVGDSADLWLGAEPTAQEVIADLETLDLARFTEVVYCGYGEPTEALGVLLETAAWLKSQGVRTRLNTNGLSDLINKRPTAPLLAGRIDAVSVSLNAGSKERYRELCRPRFGEDSFDAVLRFAKDCKQYVGRAAFTVVDVIGEEEIRKCRELADAVGIPLRVRVHAK